MPQSAIRQTLPLSVGQTSNRKPPQSELSLRGEYQEDTQNAPSEIDQSSPSLNASGSRTINFPMTERLLNAREVAARLGVSERWVRDHTTRRFPKLRGVKLGTLMRYRTADVDEFMEKLTTSKSSMQSRFGG